MTIFEPLLIRFRQRKQCVSCGDKATRKCLTHGTKLCGHALCGTEHRRMKRAVYGDLTRPFCEYRLLNTLADHALYSLVVVAVGVSFAWIWVWL